MKKILGLVALVMGAVMCVNAQVNDTVRTVAGNDLYQGDHAKVTVSADGYSVRGTGDVCQDSAYYIPVSGEVRGLG